MLEINYHLDDGRGWLALDETILPHIGLRRAYFVGESVHRDGVIYLDDRNDKQVLTKALEFCKVDYKITLVYEGVRSPIRDYDPIMDQTG